MALTLSEALTQYKENVDWEGDLTKARAALSALRVILLDRAQSQSMAGTSLNFASLERQEERLAEFVKTQVGNVHGSFTRVKTVQ